jgi:hypothetical protein
VLTVALSMRGDYGPEGVSDTRDGDKDVTPALPL